jgi:hypothetical protein
MNAKKIISLLAIAVALTWQAGAQIYDTNGDYVETFAGSGFAGDVNGVGQLTMFNNPVGVTADAQGNLFVWDANNFSIRKITADGTVSNFVDVDFYFEAMTIDHTGTLDIMVNDGQLVYLLQVGTNASVSTIQLTNAVPTGHPLLLKQWRSRGFCRFGKRWLCEWQRNLYVFCLAGGARCRCSG